VSSGPRLKLYLTEVDDRSTTGDETLLSLTRSGVRPRSEITDKGARADTLVGYRKARRGDIVLNRMQAWNGMVAITQHDGIVSPDYAVFRVAADIHPQWLHYALRTDAMRSEYVIRSRGMGTAFNRLHPSSFLDIEITAPSPRRQRAIAGYLDRETVRIDALIAAKQKMAALLEERWIAFRDEHVLSRCDPLSGTGVVPPSWQIRNLGATVTLQRGHDLPSDSRIPGDVPVVSSGGISGWHNRAACQPPGVVTGRYGTIGDTHYIDVPYWPLNTTLFVSDFRGSDPRWVYHMLAALPLSIDAEKSAVTGINRNAVGTLKVPVPPCREQQEIARAIDEVRRDNQEIENVIQTQLALLQERRQALITAVVTGRLDIAEAA
jgi:type I restriction enzyme S subunit